MTGTRHIYKKTSMEGRQAVIGLGLELARAYESSRARTHIKHVAETQGQTANNGVEDIKCKPSQASREKLSPCFSCEKNTRRDHVTSACNRAAGRFLRDKYNHWAQLFVQQINHSQEPPAAILSPT